MASAESPAEKAARAGADPDKFIEDVAKRAATMQQQQRVDEPATEDLRQKYLNMVKNNKVSHDLMLTVIGKVGAGKSSFINTYRAAVYEGWYPVAPEGASTSHKSTRIIHYFHNGKKAQGKEAAKPLVRDNQLREVPLPNFRDFAGLDPTLEPQGLTQIVRCLLYNRLPPGVTRAQLENSLKVDGLGALDKMYPQEDNKMATDRLIVVWSATEQVPENLLTVIRNVSDPKGIPEGGADVHYRACVPVFGVITNISKISEEERPDYLQRRKLFQECLGIQMFNILEVDNYNEDDHPERDNSNIATIDSEVLKFMTKVVDPLATAPVLHDDLGGVRQGNDKWIVIMLLAAVLCSGMFFYVRNYNPTLFGGTALAFGTNNFVAALGVSAFLLAVFMHYIFNFVLNTISI